MSNLIKVQFKININKNIIIFLLA